MNRTNYKLLLALPCIAFGLMVTSCGNGENESVDLSDTSETITKSARISSEAIHEVIKSIPSPVELTSLIKESGATFNKDILNNTANASSYVNEFKRSLNLGVYGADLGYINLYEKTYASIEYLNVIRSIADELKVGQFFDFTTLKRLASNSKSLDSIIYISTTSFEKMNNYLAKQQRDNVSTLMLIGGWVESIHLSCQIAKEDNNKELITRVGEQKIALDQIMILLSMFKNNKDYDNLSVDFTKLKTEYEGVKITYEYKPPVTKEVNGMLVVEDKSSSKVEITNEQFNKIAEIVSTIRTSIVK